MHGGTFAAGAWMYSLNDASFQIWYAVICPAYRSTTAATKSSHACKDFGSDAAPGPGY